MSEASELIHAIARESIAHQSALADRIVTVAGSRLDRAMVTEVVVDRVNDVEIVPVAGWSSHSGESGLQDVHHDTIQIVSLLQEFDAHVDAWTVAQSSALLYDAHISVESIVDARARTISEFVGGSIYLGAPPELVKADLLQRISHRLMMLISLLHYRDHLYERWDRKPRPQVVRWVTTREPWDGGGNPEHPGIEPPIRLQPGARYLSDRYEYDNLDTGEPHILLYNEVWDPVAIPIRIVATTTELGR